MKFSHNNAFSLSSCSPVTFSINLRSTAPVKQSPFKKEMFVSRSTKFVADVKYTKVSFASSERGVGEILFFLSYSTGSSDGTIQWTGTSGTQSPCAN